MDLKAQVETRDGASYVTFLGPIDEGAGAALSGLVSTLSAGPCILNFRNVNLVNSIGASMWIKFIEKISVDRSVTFEACSPAVVAQLNMVPSFGGNADVRSVYAPYCCPNCDYEDLLLLEKGVNLPASGEHAPPHICIKCACEMEFEGFDLKFFKFAHKKKPISPP